MEKKTKIKTLEEKIEIPSGISVDLKDKNIVLKKDSVEIKRSINPKLEFKIEGNNIIISSKKNTKRERKIFGSYCAHIKNILSGFNEKFKYRLQVATVHFPVTVTHDKDNNELVIKNFLGEKKDRRIKILPQVDVKINKEIIELESSDIEKAGQTAANIEKGTKIRFRDRRVFQDGVYIIEKPGRVIL